MQSLKLNQDNPSLLSIFVLFIIIVALLLAFYRHLGSFSIYRGILISEWVFVFLPCMIFLRFTRVRPVRFLKMAPVSIRTVAGIVLTAISGILLTGELVAIQNEIIPVPHEYLDMMRALFTVSSEMSIAEAVLVFAVTPSICEEFLFRGILLRGFLGKIPAAWAVVLSGFLFGIFHLDPYRTMGTAVLGIIMGGITIRAGSILAPVIYHLTNNLVILLVMNWAFLSQVPWLTEEAHLPVPILLLSLATFVTGLRIIGTGTERKFPSRPGLEPDGNYSSDEP